MMSVKLALLAVLALALTVSAGEQKGCNVETRNGNFLAVGESAPAKDSCENISCIDQGEGEPSVAAVNCPAFPDQDGYKVVVDASLPYPDCCPRPVKED